ncbi:MAG TPA: hypothetical protein DDW52_00205 [Planctomycetaceae bacterium]|nr:hypothetical protein [Planctomycetaceae bacterium]
MIVVFPVVSEVPTSNAQSGYQKSDGIPEVLNSDKLLILHRGNFNRTLARSAGSVTANAPCV